MIKNDILESFDKDIEFNDILWNNVIAKCNNLAKNGNIKEARNIYLKYYSKLFCEDKMCGPLDTISRGKPYLQHFSDKDILSKTNAASMYDDLLLNCEKNLDSIAIEYYGTKITYADLIKNIETVASALVNFGIKKEDKVTVSLPYLPETIYLIYALNKIGAVINMIDPRINSELMTEYISEANSKYAFIISNIDKKIEKIKDNCGLDHIVSINATNSFNNKVIRLYGSLHKTNYLSWNNFIKLAKDKVDTVYEDENSLAVIEYTSGTSGNPKGVMLSNKDFTELSHISSISYKCNVGDKFLLIMPPFIAYGLAIGMHDMLCMGQHLLVIPKFTLDKSNVLLPKLIKKYKPEFIMGVPNFLEALLNYDKDISFLKGIVIGGDHLDSKLEDSVKKALPSLNILKGWGMTEINSCGVFTRTDEVSPSGSVGVPLLGNEIKILPIDEKDIYDIDGEECYYNTDGLMFIKSPTAALGYFNKPEETSKLFYYDKNGNKWINTGDVFSIDENGYLYFKGRVKRIVVRPDGHNIPNAKIEEIARSHPLVEKAMVVGVPSRNHSQGEYAALCVKLKLDNLAEEDIERVFTAIEIKCNQELQPRDRQKSIILMNEFPLTANGKADFNTIKNMAKEKLLDTSYNEESNNMTYVISNEPKVKKRRIFSKH